MMVRRKQVRAIAERLLAEYDVKQAPVPVEQIAKARGAVVHRTPADDDLSGFLYRKLSGRQAVIGVNAKHHPNRQVFTIAHELGHFLLHEADDVHVDRGFQVKLRSGASSEGTDIEEKEANLFAAELLMPKSFLEKDLAEIDEVDLVDEDQIAALAGKYGVSTQAMTFRLAYLGYVRL